MASGGWKMVDAPPQVTALWDAHELPAAFRPKVYTRGNLTALVGREPIGGGDELRWHISVRYGDPGYNGRVPTWEEMVDAAHCLRPGVCFVIGVPPRSWWMSVHPDVLHMHETSDMALVAEYRANAMQHTPS